MRAVAGAGRIEGVLPYWLDRPDERFRQAVQQEEMVAARLQFVFALEDASLPDLLSGLDVLLESIEEMQRRTEEDLKS